MHAFSLLFLVKWSKIMLYFKLLGTTMKKTKIILVRHGESLGNATGRYLGHTNLGLSEVGTQQAEVTAQYLKNEKI